MSFLFSLMVCTSNLTRSEVGATRKCPRPSPLGSEGRSSRALTVAWRRVKRDDTSMKRDTLKRGNKRFYVAKDP